LKPASGPRPIACSRVDLQNLLSHSTGAFVRLCAERSIVFIDSQPALTPPHPSAAGTSTSTPGAALTPSAERSGSVSNSRNSSLEVLLEVCEAAPVQGCELLGSIVRSVAQAWPLEQQYRAVYRMNSGARPAFTRTMAGAYSGNAAAAVGDTGMQLRLWYDICSPKCASELFDRRHSSSKAVLLALYA
jgi:hypothetical protein